jgi:hypothetical protein
MALMLLFLAMVKSHVENLLLALSKVLSFLKAVKNTSCATSSAAAWSLTILRIMLMTGRL